MENESKISLGGAILYPNKREKHLQQNVSDKGVLEMKYKMQKGAIEYNQTALTQNNL